MTRHKRDGGRRAFGRLVLCAAALLGAFIPLRAHAQDGTRGPGLRDLAPSALRPASSQPATADELAHVDPAYVAKLLGNDAERAFAFVRDHVRFEPYRGCLRGPRGTMTSLAGNACDRAALLAALLRAGGREVRFARGKLADDDARELILSMWAPAQRARRSKLNDPDPAVRDRAAKLPAAIRADYQTIRAALQSAPAGKRSAPHTVESLVDETRQHWWVQVRDGETWVDYDPSFADSQPGRAHATADATFSELPPDVYHTVALRILIEESSGDGAAKEREILTHVAPAAQLAGLDVALLHVPENWAGPTSSVEGGITGAITATGNLKPVLLVGDEPVVGEPFRLDAAPRGGPGGVGGMLAGEGTRHAVTVAAAEYLVMTCKAPDGQQIVVRRELFDRVGPARRAAGKHLSADELKRGGKEQEFASRGTAHALLVTTGRVAPAVGAAMPQPVAPVREDELPDVGRVLRQINLTAVATADALSRRIPTGDGRAVVTYPDAPRLHVVSLLADANGRRVCLDLRRDACRAVAPDGDAELAFTAQLLRGAIAGAVEDAVVNCLTAAAADPQRWPPAFSTTALVAAARDAKAGVRLVTSADEVGVLKLPDDAAARMKQQLAGGAWLVAPERPVQFAQRPRAAWWSIDPATGHTTPVTDEGLHQAVELTVEHNKSKKETTITYRYYVGNPRHGVVDLASGDSRTFATGCRHMGDFLKQIMSLGDDVVVREFVIP